MTDAPKVTAWMPLYVGDYLADTGHLSAAEHGAYLLMIMHYWRIGGPLPADDEQLRRITRMTPKEWKASRSVLAAFFVPSDDGWQHRRIDAELTAAADNRAAQMRRTAAATAARNAKRNGVDQKPADDNVTLNVTSSPSPSPSPSPIPSREDGMKGGGAPAALPLDAKADFRVAGEPEPSAATQATPDPSARATDSPAKTAGALVLDSPPSTQSPAQQCVALWNQLAEQHGLPRVQVLTEPRQRALRRRLADAGGIEGWRAALAKVAASKFLTGANDRGWRADFDFVVREAAFTKLMEGKYDDQQRRDGDQFRNGFAQLVAEGGV